MPVRTFGLGRLNGGADRCLQAGRRMGGGEFLAVKGFHLRPAMQAGDEAGDGEALDFAGSRLAQGREQRIVAGLGMDAGLRAPGADRVEAGPALCRPACR
jgi:hypothetical protein